MTAPFKLTLKELEALRPCEDELKIIAPMLANGPLTAAEAVEKGATLEHLIWVAGEVGKTNKEVSRRLRLFATDCAARVLHVYENECDNEAPRRAIETARAFVVGNATEGELRAARKAAREAAQTAEWRARAAALAAVWAARAEWAAKSEWAAARVARAARVAIWAAQWAKHAAGDEEHQWQIDRLVYWLMEPDAGVLPLSKKHGEGT